MRIWLVKFDEPLPVDRSPRLYRMGMLAEALVQSGHEVIWWSSTLDHLSGRLRCSKDRVCDVRNDYQIRLIHTISDCSSSVSVARLFNNIWQAIRFRLCADDAPRPDMILCAMPSPELAWACAKLGGRYRVPVVIDARDMWPDIFSELLSPFKRVISRPYVAIVRSMLRFAVRRAEGCTAITEPFLDWILTYSNRIRGPKDAVIPLGFAEENVSASDLETAASVLPFDPPNVFNVIFLGRLNRTVSDAFEPVLQAVRQLRNCSRPFRFYFAGSGDYADALRDRSSSIPEIVFLGQIGPPIMTLLKRRAHVALLCVARRKDYQISLSNKVFDYLSAGLPIASHLTGLVGELVEKEKCGFIYDDGVGLESGLRKMSQNENDRQAAGERARQLFLDNYEAEKVYKGMVQHLEFVFDNRKTRI